MIALLLTALLIQDDAELARSLARRGLFDLAEEACDKLKNTPAESLVRAEISVTRAQSEDDPTEAARAYDRAVAVLANQTSVDARFLRGWIHMQRAAYEAAAETYRALVADLKPDTDDQFAARLELARANLEQAKLGGADRAKSLTTVIAELRNFQFDVGPRWSQFEAILLEGQALYAAQDSRHAEARFLAAIAIKKQLVESKVAPDDYHRRILYGATVALAQLQLHNGRASEAQKLVEQALRDKPGMYWQLALNVEKAEALLALGKPEAAHALATELSQADPRGALGDRARDIIRRCGIPPSPDELLAAAERHLERGRHPEAMPLLRSCIETCSTDAQRTKFGPVCHFKLGQCLQALKRNHEAAAAYEGVFTRYPKHELAPRACFEAAQVAMAEFALSRDPLDERRAESFVDALLRLNPGGALEGLVRYLKAAKLEAGGDLSAAAEHFLQVPDAAESYERAVARAGHCLRLAGSLERADEVLRKLVSRPKLDAGVRLVAHQELARTAIARKRPEESLKWLDASAAGMQADDRRLAYLMQLQVEANLALQRLDRACEIVDAMLQKFPDGAPIAIACRATATELYRVTLEKPPAKRDDLRRVGKYCTKWLDVGPAAGVRIRTDDLVDVASTLYQIARDLNGIGGDVGSFAELGSRRITDRRSWQDAIFAHSLLLDSAGGKLPPSTQIRLMTQRARSRGFLADSAQDWAAAKGDYEDLFKTTRLLAANGGIDTTVLMTHRELLGAYIEYGHALIELARQGQKFQLDNAFAVFANVEGISQRGSQPFWVAKYVAFSILYERGRANDIRDAKTGLSLLEKNWPDFDGGRFGFNDRFVELRKKVDALSP